MALRIYLPFCSLLFIFLLTPKCVLAGAPKKEKYDPEDTFIPLLIIEDDGGRIICLSDSFDYENNSDLILIPFVGFLSRTEQECIEIHDSFDSQSMSGDYSQYVIPDENHSHLSYEQLLATQSQALNCLLDEALCLANNQGPTGFWLANSLSGGTFFPTKHSLLPNQDNAQVETILSMFLNIFQNIASVLAQLPEDPVELQSHRSRRFRETAAQRAERRRAERRSRRDQDQSPYSRNRDRSRSPLCRPPSHHKDHQ